MNAIKYRGNECKPMASRQIYFCGSNAPIAALIDGKKLLTPQWVDVDDSKLNIRDHKMHTINANNGNKTVKIANEGKAIDMEESTLLSPRARYAIDLPELCQLLAI